MAGSGTLTRAVTWRIEVTGTVQGVGFRPFVWRTANALRLEGTVRNAGGAVEIVATGGRPALDAFAELLRSSAPQQANVDRVAVTQVDDAALVSGVGFTVLTSSRQDTSPRLFPADLATCPSCVGELFDPTDRRYRYPFVNCTDCGPRATIIDALPYDRASTSMRRFPLCPDCAAEYADPADRRFHAEPVACPSCGPQLRWAYPSRLGSGKDVGAQLTSVGPAGSDGALARAVATLRCGGIVAVKGLGGYHLVCDATNERSVAALRERKRRWAKPFAVMVADLATASALGELDETHAGLLASAAAPIVLADLADGARSVLAPSVLAGSTRVGLMLAYTPLHHLLLADLGRPLVMTSGNLAEEPIAMDEAEAHERLDGLVDGFLHHDRPILARYEDSVCHVVEHNPVFLRRARGYAPTPLCLPVAADRPILAVGAQSRHTFTLASGALAYVGSHIGDLDTPAAIQAWQTNQRQLGELVRIDPYWCAHDRHQGYTSTMLAERTFPAGRRTVVQHHHAHIASCSAEHGVSEPVIGVALDGLGMGDDGTMWGGEILHCDLVGYRRLGRFLQAALPGGTAAVRNPWRTALGYLFGSEGGRWCDPDLARRLLERHDKVSVAVIEQQIERHLNSPVASSAGRLFDAASHLLGLCDTIGYTGHAAVLVEQAADPYEQGLLPYLITKRDGLDVFDPRPALAELLAMSPAGGGCGNVATLAARFQRTVAEAVSTMAVRSAGDTGCQVVCLSGGAFANAFLLGEIRRRVRAAGLTVLHNERVPAGDGGISFGQAAVAAARSAMTGSAVTGLAVTGLAVTGPTTNGPANTGEEGRQDVPRSARPDRGH